MKHQPPRADTSADTVTTARQRAAVAVCTGVGLAAAALGTTVSWPLARYGWWVDVPLHGFGAVAVVVGAAIWLRTPLHRVGQLIMLVGSTFHFGDLRASTQPALFAVGVCLGYVWVAVLAHLALAWPTGSPRGRVARALVPVCYLCAVASQLLRYVVDDPQPPQGYDLGGPVTPAARVGSAMVVALGAVVLTVIVRRWLRASAVSRRPSGPFWAAGVVTSALALSFSLTSLLGSSAQVQFSFAVGGLLLGLFLVPAVYLIQLVRAASAQARLARIALELDRGIGVYTEPGQLRDVLAEALGDPGLLLTFPPDAGPVPAAGVDRRSGVGERRPAPDPDGHAADQRIDAPRRDRACGAAATLSPTSPGRIRTPVYRGERLVCVIEHDETLGQQPAVAQAAAAAAGLAIERSELYERLHQQMRQLNESRHRLAEAGLEERRRIQRDLHDRAQQQLYGVLGQLGIARLQLAGVAAPEAAALTATVEQAHAHLRRAVEELSLLIQAIYPAVLSEHGLAAAVDELADQAPVPVTVRIPTRRWPEPLVRTAYFIIAEALGNVYKHAHATQVSIDVTDWPDRLVIAIVDDGIGLPTAPHPPRLRSLVDRADAADGSLHVESAAPRGTRVVAELPKEHP